MAETAAQGMPRAANSVAIRAGMILSAAALAVYLIACAYYALGSTLGGHGEASVVCTAWEFRQGHEVYPAADATARTAMVYGPMEPAVLGAIFWLFGPQLAAVKIAGGFMAILGLLCCWRVFRRTAGSTAAFLALGWLALVYLKYTVFTYYLRPDSGLQLCLSLCLLATFCLPRKSAWIVFAMALAWGVNLKITMPVYAFPLMLLFRQRHGLTSLLLALASSAVLAAAPFIVFPQVSAAHYFSWLTMASAEGTERTMIIPVGGYLILLTAPAAAVIALFALRRPAAFRALAYRHRWFAIAAAVTVLVVLRITGKPGAGPPHLLPLFPILGVVLARSLAELHRPAGGVDVTAAPAPKLAVKTAAAVGLLALVILVGFDMKGAWMDVFKAYPWSQGEAWSREIARLADKFPRQAMSMAPGATQQSYPALRYLPVLVLRGNPYILDVPAMMDMQKSGREIPQSTRDYIAAGTCPLWLVPRGEAPFTMRNWYEPRGMIFDASFRQTFADHYKIIDHSEHFDVWHYQP